MRLDMGFGYIENCDQSKFKNRCNAVCQYEITYIIATITTEIEECIKKQKNKQIKGTSLIIIAQCHNMQAV